MDWQRHVLFWSYIYIYENITEVLCQVCYTILKKRLLNVLYHERLDSFKTKNRKLATLIAKQGDSYKSSTCSTPLINLFFFLSKWIHISTNKITMMIKQKIKNITKYNNINNTRNYTNTEP